MNRYERNLMFNIKVMKILYLVIVCLNIFLPIKAGMIFYLSIPQIIICFIWLFGLLNGMGYFSQHLPILPIGITRFIEILYYGVLRGSMNWWAFAIQVMVDIIYFTFLVFDKSNYTYEREVTQDGIKANGFR